MSKFSVRHDRDGGSDLYQCDKVTFHSHDTDALYVMGALELHDHDGVFVAGLWGGMAYVMNAAGKTVARYDLPADQEAAWRLREAPDRRSVTAEAAA